MPAIKECISLHIGQAGCQVGFRTWELFTEEHGINPDGTRGDDFTDFDPDDDAFSGFFHETGSGQYVPRCVMVDTEPTVINDIKASRMSNLFHPDSMIAFKKDSRNNYFEGAMMAKQFKIADVVMDRIRNAIDVCDNPQGFFVIRALGGGTGSGVGNELLKDMRDTFGKKAIFEPLIYPSKSYSSAVVEPYNCVFGTVKSREFVDLSLMLDNEAAYSVCMNNLQIKNPDFFHVNSLISQCISAATGPLRYETELNATLDEIQRNLVPSPLYKHAIVSLAPIRHIERMGHEKFKTHEIITELFNGKNLLCDTTGLSMNRFLAAVVLLRGDRVGDDSVGADEGDSGGTGFGTTRRQFHAISPNSVIKALNDLRSPPKGKTHTQTLKFVPWMEGSGVKVSIVRARPVTTQGFCMATTRRQGIMLGNNTCVRQLFVRNYVRYLQLMFGQAYMWQFAEANGGEMDVFEEAKEQMRIIIDNYEDLMTSSVEMENERINGAGTARMTLSGTTTRRINHT